LPKTSFAKENGTNKLSILDKIELLDAINYNEQIMTQDSR